MEIVSNFNVLLFAHSVYFVLMDASLKTTVLRDLQLLQIVFGPFRLFHILLLVGITLGLKSRSPKGSCVKLFWKDDRPGKVDGPWRFLPHRKGL